MHICHVNLARGYRGGERQTELLIESLARQRLAQSLVARHGSPLFEHLANTPGLDLRPIRKPFILHAARLGQADLVHAHEAKAVQLAGWAQLRGRRPYLITRRVDAPPSAGLLNRQLYRRAARVVAVSGKVRDVLQKVFPGLTVEVVHDAHSALRSDPATVASLRAQYAGKFVVGHAGALVNRHKGQLYLIEAARGLRERCRELVVLLLGSGEDEAMLRAAARGLDNVVFAGFQRNLGDWFAVMDVFAFPSLYEGLGSVILDAMHLGLPVVASRVGGIPEIVQDECNGLLIPPGNAQALAQALLRLRDQAELRHRLAQAARQTAQRFAPEAMTQAYLAQYRACLSAEVVTA